MDIEKKLKDLDNDYRGVLIKLSLMKEQQKKIIDKLNKIIKRVNNTCFIYSSDDDTDNDSLDKELFDYLCNKHITDDESTDNSTDSVIVSNL
jgi:hypothetical protein